MANAYEIWKGKDLSALFRDIYQNQRTTQSQITILIDSLRPLIKNSADAAVIVPLIRDYLDVSVKNDSHLVRLAGVVERLYAAEKLASAEGGVGQLTDAELKNLMEIAEQELKIIRGSTEQSTRQVETLKVSAKELTEPPKDEDESETEE